MNPAKFKWVGITFLSRFGIFSFLEFNFLFANLEIIEQPGSVPKIMLSINLKKKNFFCNNSKCLKWSAALHFFWYQPDFIFKLACLNRGILKGLIGRLHLHKVELKVTRSNAWKRLNFFKCSNVWTYVKCLKIENVWKCSNVWNCLNQSLLQLP
jgi:hypothetical protein